LWQSLSRAMQLSPQALPFLQILQHSLGAVSIPFQVGANARLRVAENPPSANATNKARMQQ